MFTRRYTMPENLYTPPPLPTGLLPRFDLRQNLKAAARTGKHLALCAPGGYGKTVVALQLVDTVRQKAAWLTLSTEDTNPSFFYARLLGALRLLTPKGVPQPESGGLGAVLAVANRLTAYGGRRYLVLDDFHRLLGPDIPRHLSLLLDALPRAVTVVISSRTALPESIAVCRRGFMVTSTAELAFSAKEAAQLSGLDENEDAVMALWERTGGWAIALQALAGETIIERSSFPSTLDGYLEIGVWRQWDENARDCLLRCAIPPYVTGTMARQLVQCKDGAQRLDELFRAGALLSQIHPDVWCFHDLFRDWLNQQAEIHLGPEEMTRLRRIAADCLYEREDYYAAARLHIQNGDHEGINRCMRAQNSYGGSAQNLSVETKVNFINSYVAVLPPEFVEQNPYLLSKCANAAFLDGDVHRFTRFTDVLFAQLPTFASKHPDLVQTAGFIGSLDFRIPLREYARRMAVLLQNTPSTPKQGADKALSSTITQNLPLMHRSMRDYSEYHELAEVDIALLRTTFGVMIGRDYPVMEHCYVAGMHYEQGHLREANYYALLAIRACDHHMQAETVLCANMMMGAVYDALGATREAGHIYAEMEAFTETPETDFLRLNCKAMTVSRALRMGDSTPAEEWLTLYAVTAHRLPFYQMFRHFATLRSYLALEQNEQAAEFGTALGVLAQNYRRPIDQIECGILTALAWWRMGKQRKALGLLAQSIELSHSYGFVQQFINEGREVLPIIWALQAMGGKTTPTYDKDHLNRIQDAIYATYDFVPQPEYPVKLPPKQLKMLSFLHQGMSYSEIAEQEGVKHGTVKTHILQMYKTLEVHNAEDALAKAQMLGLLE